MLNKEPMPAPMEASKWAPGTTRAAMRCSAPGAANDVATSRPRDGAESWVWCTTRAATLAGLCPRSGSAWEQAGSPVNTKHGGVADLTTGKAVTPGSRHSQHWHRMRADVVHGGGKRAASPLPGKGDPPASRAGSSSLASPSPGRLNTWTRPSRGWDRDACDSMCTVRWEKAFQGSE